MRASNDPSEGNFGCFSDAFEECNGADITASAGRGQIRFNGDCRRGAEWLVSGRRSAAERAGEEVEPPPVGLFHELRSELRDSLILTSKCDASKCHQESTESLRRQSAMREVKQKAKRGKKVGAVRDDLIPHSYLHQQYESPRCWLTEE